MLYFICTVFFLFVFLYLLSMRKDWKRSFLCIYVHHPLINSLCSSFFSTTSHHHEYILRLSLLHAIYLFFYFHSLIKRSRGKRKELVSIYIYTSLFLYFSFSLKAYRNMGDYDNHIVVFITKRLDRNT